MLIVALGRTAPVESVTMPVTVPTGACADMSRIMQQNRHTSSTADRLHIELPPFFGANLLLSQCRSQRLRQCLRQCLTFRSEVHSSERTRILSVRVRVPFDQR